MNSGLWLNHRMQSLSHNVVFHGKNEYFTLINEYISLLKFFNHYETVCAEPAAMDSY